MVTFEIPRTEWLATDEAGDLPTVPGYRVLREIARGGMGRVLAALDLTLDREVALKVLLPGANAGRFARESRITARLPHPGIPPVHALGTLPDGSPFLAMKLVVGQTLAAEMKTADRPRLLRAFTQVCQAVGFAHSRGVIHRDLKPANVMVGAFGEVQVMDWGLAKELTGREAPGEPGPPAAPPVGPAYPDPNQTTNHLGAGESTEDQTQAGTVLGTPAYMAPEAAMGIAATTAVDVYGLGAILYTLLAGRPPYTGATAADVLRKVATTDPAPFAAADSPAPPALAAICRKAMARDPGARYPSADALAADIQGWLADEPVAAYREPWPARAARWARRHRTSAVGAAALLLTATVASLIATGLVWREQRHTRAEQINTAKNAEAAIDVVRKLSTYVESYEMSSGSCAATERERKERLDAALASYERVLELHPDDPVLRWNVARMHRMRANLSRFLDRFDDAEQSYGEAIRLLGRLAADFPEETRYREVRALTLRDFGLSLHRLGRRQEADKLVGESAVLFEELWRAAPDEPNHNRVLAQLLLGRSDWEREEGRLAESERSARRSSELYARLAALPGARPDPLDPLFHAMVEHNLAMTLRERGRLDEALAAHDRAVERVTDLTRKQPNNRNARSFYHRARVERAWTLGRLPGRAADAIAELQSAIQGWDKLIKESGETPVDIQRQGVAGYYCGRLQADAGQHDAAAGSLAAAAKIQEAILAKQPQIPESRYDLGRTYVALGQLAGDSQEAAGWYRKASEMLDAAVQRYPENFMYRQALAELDALPKDPKP